MDYSKMAEAISKLLKQDNKSNMILTTEAWGKIGLWTDMYKNRAPWVNGTTVFSMNIPASISSEIARLITIESKIEISGSARATYLNGEMQKLQKNLRKNLEYGVAKGGLIFKPYVTPTGMYVQSIQADSFFPIAFDDNDRITKIVFVEQFQQGRNIYTRLEFHEHNGSTVKITNRAFHAFTETTLGNEINLKEVEQWANLQYQTTLQNIDKPLYGYYRFAQASPVFDKVPIGASCFSNAVNLIQEADRRYSSECWEFEAKEAAVNVSKNMLIYDKETDSYRKPLGKDRLYRDFDFDQGARDKPFIQEYSPDIRQEAYSKGINEQLRKIEFNCNLAYGTLSNPENVDKTAEEIKASKQRSYAMVSDNQKALQTALEDFIDAVNVYASLYGLAPSGRYEAQFNWDDSIIQDADKERMQDMQDVNSGIMQKWEYRMKWYGETEEQAKAKLGSSGIIIGDDE